MSIRELLPYKKIPVLLYHRIADTSNSDVYNNITVTPDVFDRQMNCLFQQGYTTNSLDDMVTNAQYEYASRKCVITFDDGYLDNYTIAYPILIKYGFTATFFLTTNFVGKSHAWDSGGPISYMSWAQAREMLKQGFIFGSHTCMHPDLTAVTEKEMMREITVSRKKIEDKLGISVAHFSYPFGRFNRRAKECVEKAGYFSACSVSASDNDCFSIERFMISDNSILFRIKTSKWSSWIRKNGKYIRICHE